jgi:hypothetical protein
LALTAALLPVRAAQAQVPFQVIRPENGATVREVVHIQMARRALEDAGVKYLSFSIDGKFREALAVLPLPQSGEPVTSDSEQVNKQTVTLLWNTKVPPANTSGSGGSSTNPLGVEDGSHTIEIVAQSSDGRRLGSQTLTLDVENRGGLTIPGDGLLMDYRFDLGDTSHYRELTVVEFEGDRTENTPPPQGGGGRPLRFPRLPQRRFHRQLRWRRRVRPGWRAAGRSDGHGGAIGRRLPRRRASR